MRRTVLFLALLLPALSFALQLPIEASTPAARIVQCLNFGWKFYAGDADEAPNADFDDGAWEEVNLPHDFQIAQPWIPPAEDEKADNSDMASNVKSRLSPRGFKEMGIGWYRKEIVPEDDWQGKRIIIDFEGIMLVGDVFLNGKRIGGTEYGYVGFDIDISDLIEFGKPNVIAVKANTGQPENSRWYTGGGLFRDVNLIVTDSRQYFTRHPLYIITSQVSVQNAAIKIQAEIACFERTESLKVNTAIVDMYGNIVADDTKDIPSSRRQQIKEYTVDSITMADPHLWSCDTPYLYKAIVTLYRTDGTIADQVCENFGIRSIEYSPEFGFKLNGEKVVLKGIANHHTLGALGAAAYPRAIEKRIQLLKDFGFNHIRTSHNPYSKSFLDLCDRYGILVVDELYDKWLTQYAGGRTQWIDLWQYDVPEFVCRDRNHPSVVMWSLGNELQTYWSLPYADWGVTPYRLQKTLLDRYDTTRPVTVAMHPRGRNEQTDSLPAPLVMETDIAAYNYRYMYFSGDGHRFPNLIFYQSEASASNMGANYYGMDLDKVVGLAYWGMIDYLGESNGWPAKGWAQGIFDISLEPKPAAWFLRSIFKEDEPVVHIAIMESENNSLRWNDVEVGTQRMSDHWNFRAGRRLSLYTYTNADEVELLVNGKSIGKKKNDRTDPNVRNRIRWNNVAYENGSIEAVAWQDGKVVAHHKIETTTDAVRLVVEADNPAWIADGIDLQHVRVCAVDKKGRRVQSAQNEIKFTVEGPAEIVGVINGDINSNELTVGNTRHLYNGVATVILRASRTAGEVTLTASANDLKKATIVFSTENQ